MLFGVFSKYYEMNDSKKEDYVKIEYHDSVKVLTLLNFLDYAQKGQTEFYNSLSPESQKIFRKAYLEGLSDFNQSGILGNAISLMKGCSDELLKEIKLLCGDRVGRESEVISYSQYKAEVEESDEKIFAIKRVTFYGDVTDDSECSLKVPTAYMVRSRRDSEGNLKTWPSDSQVAEIIAQLRRKTYYSSHDLIAVIQPVAQLYGVNSDVLFVMVQCLLTDKLIELLENGFDVNSPYEVLINNLFSLL